MLLPNTPNLTLSRPCSPRLLPSAFTLSLSVSLADGSHEGALPRRVVLCSKDDSHVVVLVPAAAAVRVRVTQAQAEGNQRPDRHRHHLPGRQPAPWPPDVETARRGAASILENI